METAVLGYIGTTMESGAPKHACCAPHSTQISREFKSGFHASTISHDAFAIVTISQASTQTATAGCDPPLGLPLLLIRAGKSV